VFTTCFMKYFMKISGSCIFSKGRSRVQGYPPQVNLVVRSPVALQAHELISDEMASDPLPWFLAPVIIMPAVIPVDHTLQNVLTPDTNPGFIEAGSPIAGSLALASPNRSSLSSLFIEPDLP
jgi:hypothetical protein